MSTSTGELVGHDPHQPYLGQMFPRPSRGSGPGDSGGDDSGSDTVPDDYPITTWVVVDGVTMPCGTDDLRIGQPTVMDGLSFGWGRETIVDQPDANTCSFVIREELAWRDLGVNQVEDPGFADEELNAARFPADWMVDGGQVQVGGGHPEQVEATNLITDPGFEYGTGGFTPATTTAQDTGQVHSGATSSKITPINDTAGYDSRCAFAGEAGVTYTFSAWQWVPSGTTRGRNLAMGQGVQPIVQYNDDPMTFDDWQFVQVSNTAPADGTMYVHLYGGDVAGQQVWYDDLGLTVGTVPVDFSGDTPASGDNQYRWTGTPGSSSSQQYIPAVEGNADSYRVWLIGDRMAGTSSSPPAAPAPDHGQIEVVPGEQLQLSYTATASVDRTARWQLATYDPDGALIQGNVYLPTQQLTAGVAQELAWDWTVPDGVAYVAAAINTPGGFGGTVMISDPNIHATAPDSTLDLIHVGSKVEVWSTADIPATDAQTMDDSGFAGYGSTFPTENWTRISGGSGITIPPPISSFQGSDPAVWFIKPDVFDDYSIQAAFGPRPFVTGDDTVNPNAWDLVPRLAPGVEWTVHAHVYVPPGTTATLKAWAFDGPHKDNQVGECVIGTNDGGEPISATGVPEQLITGTGWYDLTGTVTLPADLTEEAGYWIAPGVEFATLPSPLTWNDPAVAGWTWKQQILRWIDLQRGGIDYLSLLQAEAAPRTDLVWSGEVVDLRAQAAGDYAVSTSVTASDLSSILANVKVGDEPWSSETLAQRADKIMALIPTSPPLVIDEGLQDTVVSYRDVDAQAPLGLLQDLAQTAGGVLWITAHATEGAYLWMEDPRTREAVRRFVIDGDGTVSITDGNDPISGIAVISAMDILRDPVVWTQDVAQVITQASVSWLDQIPPAGEGEQASTQEYTEVVQDTADVIKKYGVRDASVSTELVTAQDARELAARILAMSRGIGWKVDGLQYDTILLCRDIDSVDYPQRLTTIMDLLDATTRIGYAFTLIDPPDWTPAGAVKSMYVEGGTWTWDGRRWVLDITATPSQGQGISARWEDFDGTGVTWEDFRPNRIRWLDAYGTSGPQVNADQDQLQEAGK